MLQFEGGVIRLSFFPRAYHIVGQYHFGIGFGWTGITFYIAVLPGTFLAPIPPNLM